MNNNATVIEPRSEASVSIKPAEGVKTEPAVQLTLFAPYNESVELLADFFDWQPRKMARGDDGWWRIEVDLPDGEYLYKFRVKSTSYFAAGQTVDVFDPYALSVTNDEHENSILRIRDGKRLFVDYEWKHDDKPLPVNQELVIYEMHVGDFSGGKGDEGGKSEREKGQFKHVIEKLDYIKDLGINCIELLPVKEFPGKGWGYSLRSLFAVENSYGSPEDLCRLVDEAHARGIRVIIDGVYNHSEADAPMAKIAYEYWYYHPNPDPDYLQWGPKFNYTHYDKNLDLFPARKYVKDSISFWVEKFHIDGIRFDATVAIRDFNILRELADAAYDKVNGAKPFFTVAEHLPEDPAITQRSHGAPMDAAWHDSLARLLQANILGKEVDGIHPYDLDALAAKLNPATNGYGDGGRYVNFISNHDFHRIMHMLGADAKTFDEAAFRRVKLGLGLLLTAPGIPMLWMGQEFGFSSEKTFEPRPLDWSLLRHDNNKSLRQYCQTLIGARRDHIALRKDTFECLLSDKQRSLFGYKRWDEGGNVAVIVANLRDEFAGEFEINSAGLEDGSWREIINGYDANVSGGVLRDSLAESEVKVFIRQG